MTENEAHSLAAQRERHKSKHMTHKRWTAQHDSVKGWHVALVDVALPAAPVQLESGLTFAGVALCVAMFGPAATAQALAALARHDLGTIEPLPTGRVKPVNKYVIPHPHKRERI